MAQPISSAAKKPLESILKAPGEGLSEHLRTAEDIATPSKLSSPLPSAVLTPAVQQQQVPGMPSAPAHSKVLIYSRSWTRLRAAFDALLDPTILCVFPIIIVISCCCSLLLLFPVTIPYCYYFLSHEVNALCRLHCHRWEMRTCSPQLQQPWRQTCQSGWVDRNSQTPRRCQREMRIWVRA